MIACAHQLHFRQTSWHSVDLLREHIADAFLVQCLPVIATDPDQILADNVHQGVDQGRFDHQPFNWMGQQVNPVPSVDGNGWGFWFLGQWIPL